MTPSPSPSDGKLVIAANKKAWHHFEIMEEFEAGLQLKGPEVKSVRDGKVSLDGSFARVDNGELLLYNLYIAPYANNTSIALEPTRTRKLLMNRNEIERMIGKTQTKGLTLVALEIYFRRGWAKIRLGLGRGKKAHDKRDTIKKKDAAREMERSFKSKFKL